MFGEASLLCTCKARPGLCRIPRVRVLFGAFGFRQHDWDLVERRGVIAREPGLRGVVAHALAHLRADLTRAEAGRVGHDGGGIPRYVDEPGPAAALFRAGDDRIEFAAEDHLVVDELLANVERL